jgi:hypothetical protein
VKQQQLIRNTEDWWALWIGLFVFLVSLGPLVGKDLLGWGAGAILLVFLVWVSYTFFAG